jgi:hypothetical protein
MKRQNSGLPYSNVAAMRIRSGTCLSKTSVLGSSTYVPEYVTADNYEENLENFCLNEILFIEGRVIAQCLIQQHFLCVQNMLQRTIMTRI